MLTLLLCEDWTTGNDIILHRIAKEVAEEKAGRVLIVPELVSHETERALCEAAGDSTSRFAEVLTFSRLASRTSELEGYALQECLDNGGRLVAMAAAARQLSSRLKAYASLETRPEFLVDMVNAVDEFKRCCILPENLMDASRKSDGKLSQKLEDLALLMSGYNAVCAHGKKDPRDQMTWLLEQMQNSNYAQEHIFYIEGFPDFTRQHMEILEHIIKYSPAVFICMNCDAPGSDKSAFEKAGHTAAELIRTAQRNGILFETEQIPPANDELYPVRKAIFQGPFPCSACVALHVYQAGSPMDEVMWAAYTARKLASDGCRWRDITLVCTDISIYQPLINLIFHRMHIPVYLSGTEEILKKSVIATVLTALDAALGGYEQADVIRYFRTTLCGMDENVCDRIQNYAILWGIHGSEWQNTWTKNPHGLSEDDYSDLSQELHELNRIREQYISPLTHLTQGFRKASCLAQKVSSLYTFLSEIQMPEKLEALAAKMEEAGRFRECQILNQLWDILLNALEQLRDTLGESEWENDQFVRLLRLLLSQYSVGTIPPVLDAVQAGTPASLRCHHAPHLILIGADEGKLPGYSGTAGILTDAERTELRRMELPLTGGALEGIQSEFADIYGVFCGARSSISVCSGGQPSYIYKRLAVMTGISPQPVENDSFAGADKLEAAAWLAQFCLEQQAGELGIHDEYKKISEKVAYNLGPVSHENTRKLYGSTLMMSASQLDSQAECRMSYFMQYGLKVKEQKEVQIDSAEFGTYVHAVLENTCREIKSAGGFHSVDLNTTLEIAHKYSSEYADKHFSQLSSVRAKYLFQRNLYELDLITAELWRELSHSEFIPEGFEVDFGDSAGGYKAIRIPNTASAAFLRGFVDRVDIWKDSGITYFRIVDYKTGKKAFDYCDIYNGVGLQMLLYLFALKACATDMLGSSPVPAGVQYFPARAEFINLTGISDPAKLENSLNARWVRSGLLLDDKAVLQAMEPGDNPSRCYKIKGGKIEGNLASRDQMRLLENHIFHEIGNLVDQILSGCVDPNPYTRGNSHNACQFCPYGSVCRGDHAPGRRNYEKMSSEQFWNALEEEKNHG